MSAIAGRVLLIPKGNYDATATYTMLDMVVYNGSSYICKQECTGVVPTNTTYWMLNASGSAVAYINDIGDVVITNPTNGQVLMYNRTTQKWVNGTLTLNSLTDTQFASLTNGQVLKYNSTSQKWENADEAGGILPHLIVISETGSTVTATKGQTVITATETSTGHFECDLPEFGTWTIDAILGGEDAQVSLVVDTVKVYTVDDSHYHGTVTVKYPDGATCRLQSADETLYATGSPYTFTVHHTETYTITVTYNQRIYTDTVTFTTEGQSFSKTLPSPSDADANDINMWLFFGGVSGSYSSLADILADSTALSLLMASTNAVDYLVRCTNWISDICGNQSAMSYIGLNNYCANTLLADADWLDGIGNSDYIENVMNIKVPTMTGYTTPSGEVFTGGSKDTNREAWMAFDKVLTLTDGHYWLPKSEMKHNYIGYVFTHDVKIRVVKVLLNNNYYASRTSINITVQSGVNKDNFTDISANTQCATPSTSTWTTIICNEQNESKNSFRLYDKDNVAWHTDSGASTAFIEVQFYGREDV